MGDANGVAGVDDAGREAVESGPDADEGREKDGTKAREIPKARVGDEQRVRRWRLFVRFSHPW